MTAMALGLHLWVSLTCFLLFNSSAGFPTQKEWPEVVPAELLPYTPHASDVNHLRSVNDEPIDFSPEDFNIYSLKPEHQLNDQAMAQPGSNQLNVASSNTMPHSPGSADDSAHYASAAAYYGPMPVYTSQDDSWQPEPLSSGYGVVDLGVGFPNTGSSADSGYWNNHRLVFEEVFHYPTENTGSSPLNYGTIANTAGGYSQVDYMSKGLPNSYAFMLDEPTFLNYPVNVADQPVSAPGMQSSYPSSYSKGKAANYQPPNVKMFWLPQKPGMSPKKEVSQREAKQILHPAQSYTIKLRDGYQYGRNLNKPWHSLELPPPVPVSSESAEGPAESTSYLQE